MGLIPRSSSASRGTFLLAILIIGSLFPFSIHPHDRSFFFPRRCSFKFVFRYQRLLGYRSLATFCVFLFRYSSLFLREYTTWPSPRDHLRFYPPPLPLCCPPPLSLVSPYRKIPLLRQGEIYSSFSIVDRLCAFFRYLPQTFASDSNGELFLVHPHPPSGFWWCSPTIFVAILPSGRHSFFPQQSFLFH